MSSTKKTEKKSVDTKTAKKITETKAPPEKKHKTALELVMAGRAVVAKRGILPISPRISGYTSCGCYALDLCMSLGKGIPWGKVIEVYGPKAAGKTFLAMNAAREMMDKGGAVWWYDIEGGWSETFADLNSMEQEHELFTLFPQTLAEHALSSIVDLCKSYKGEPSPALIVIDSLGRLNTKWRDDNDLEDGRKPGNVAQVLNDFFTLLASHQACTNCTVLLINQEYKGLPRPGMGHLPPPTYTKGGGGPEYAAFIRIRLAAFDMQSDSKGVPRYGLVKATVTKNKMEMPSLWCTFPVFFRQTSSRVYGLDDAFACITLLIALGAIETTTTKKEDKASKADSLTIKLKWEGEELTTRAMRDRMHDDPSIYRKVKALVKTAFYKFYKISEE